MATAALAKTCERLISAMAVRLLDLQLLYGIAGARDLFEHLCAQLIHAEFPMATGIRVHKGDHGVAIYKNKFTDKSGTHVFQTKYFPNGVGESQRQQIRDSFTRCRSNHRFVTNRWTLCLPVDLSVEETQWFTSWAEHTSSESGIEIDCPPWGATRLEGLLYEEKNRGIKEAFFKEEHLTQIREMHGVLSQLLQDFPVRTATRKAPLQYQIDALDAVLPYLKLDLEKNNAASFTPVDVEDYLSSTLYRPPYSRQELYEPLSATSVVEGLEEKVRKGNLVENEDGTFRFV